MDAIFTFVKRFEKYSKNVDLLIAGALIAILFVWRMQSHAATAARRSGAATDASIARIRGDRSRRMERRK